MLTRLRHVAALVLLAMCFAAVAVWWRSYSVVDIITGHLANDDGVCVHTFDGKGIVWGAAGLNLRYKWEISTDNAAAWREFYLAHPKYDLATTLGFGFGQIGGTWRMEAPLGFLAMLALANAFAVRPSPRFRFNSRELLIAVTLAAIVCGIVAMMPRG